MRTSNATIGLFGGLSDFTFHTLELLISARLVPSFVVLHAFGAWNQDRLARIADIAVPEAPKVVRLCEEHRIAMHFHFDDIGSLTSFIDRHDANYFLLACYPVLLPERVAELAGADCINIHPSLLPKYRGPNPLFWQLRLGEQNTGVTLHRVASRLDAGDIVSALKVPIESGCRIDAIERSLLRAAVEILKRQVQLPRSDWKLQWQDSGRATWHASPCDSDYVISTDESAATVFRFVRAYGNQNLPLSVESGSTRTSVTDALKWSSSLQDCEEGLVDAGHITLEFADGFVRFAT